MENTASITNGIEHLNQHRISKRTDTIDIQEALASWPAWANNEPLLSAELGGGLSNQSFLLSESNAPRYVIRLNQSAQQQPGIDRQQEIAILKTVSAQGLCPELLYNDPNEQFIVYHYLQGQTLANQKAEPRATVADIAGLLKAIHTTELSFHAKRLDLIDYCQTYWQTLEDLNQPNVSSAKIMSSLEPIHCRMQPVFKRAKQSIAYTHADCLCHNDLNPENIIQYQGHGQLFAIDWEYASLGNRYFDLACVCETHLFSPNQVDELLTLYHRTEANPAINHRYSLSLQPYRLIYRYIELLWLAYTLGTSNQLDQQPSEQANKHRARLQQALENNSSALEQRLNSVIV